MKGSLAIALLVFALSLCNLADRLSNINKNQNGGSSNSQNTNGSNTNSSTSQESSPPNPTNQNGTADSSNPPVSDNILNGQAISKPDPVYPPVARAARASGTVTVQVTVDETGKVTSAQAISGHPLLRAAATQAAYQARFKPTLSSGKPVKASGVLTYDFKP
jgi:TonB family protein